jgi:hypothetical protein
VIFGLTPFNPRETQLWNWIARVGQELIRVRQMPVVVRFQDDAQREERQTGFVMRISRQICQ